MIKKISELFDYGDEIVVVPRGGECDPSEIKELTMKKIHEEQKSRTVGARTQRRGRPAWRVALAAVIAVLLLGGAALAVYTITMSDRVLAEEPLFTADDGHEMYQYSPVGAAAGAEETADMASTPSGETHFLRDGAAATAASSGNTEFAAAQAWWTYSRAVSEADFDELLPEDDPARLYGAGWRAMAEKLESIAEANDLRLYQRGETFSELDLFYAAAGIAPIPGLENAYDTGCSAVVYDEGSFLLNAVTLPVTMAGEEFDIALNLHRDAKGSLSGDYLLGDDPACYTYESYTASDGITAELALGDRYSFIFAELNGCWITVFVNGGGQLDMEYLPTIDMAVLRQLADQIGFAALDIG